MPTRKAPPAPPPPPPPRTRAIWVAEFAHAAIEQWPEVGLRHANTVGLSRWAANPTADPAESAAQWVTQAKNSAKP